MAQKGYYASDMQNWSNEERLAKLNQYGQAGLTENTYNWLVNNTKGYSPAASKVSGDQPQQSVYVPYTSKKATTQECAQFANDQLRASGIHMPSGNAWSQAGSVVYNGYANTTPKVAPTTVSGQMNHGYAATRDLYKNFDVNGLDKSKVYTVNMWYKGSPNVSKAYADDDKNNIFGTHTGNLYWDGKKWAVQHNIHGTIHNDAYANLGNIGGRYGITAIQDPNKYKGGIGYVRSKLYGVGKTIGSLFAEEGGVLNYLDYIS